MDGTITEQFIRENYSFAYALVGEKATQLIKDSYTACYLKEGEVSEFSLMRKIYSLSQNRRPEWNADGVFFQGLEIIERAISYLYFRREFSIERIALALGLTQEEALNYFHLAKFKLRDRTNELQ